MARDATITQEQVNAAADTIRAGGVKPTARAVREQLGTGSMATVLKFLQVWQSGQIKAVAPDVTLPPAIQRQLVDFVSQEVAQARGDLQADLVIVQQAQTDLIAESERQASTIETQAAALDAAITEKAELAGRLAQLESDLARSTDDVVAERTAAEHARTELAKAQLRLEAVPRIEAEADRLRAELGTESKARVVAEQQAAVLTAKLEAAIERATKSEKHADLIEQQGKQTAQDLASARQQVQAQQVSIDAAVRELDDTKKATETAREAAKQAGEQAAELRGQLIALKPVSVAPKASKKG